MFKIFLSIGLFLGFMIPTLLASAMPRLAIKILELFRVYEPGTLKVETTTYTTGSGYYRQGKVFIYRDEKVSERFDNGRVFGYMLLIFIPLFFIISVFTFFVFQIYLI